METILGMKMCLMIDMKYSVIFTRKAGEFIKNAETGYRRKLQLIIEKLSENPYSYPYKKLRGYTSLFRIRIGKYRILYEVDKQRKIIIILKIEKRENVYG